MESFGPAEAQIVAAVGCDSTTRTLYVAFKNGRTYEYYNVPVHLYEALLLPPPVARRRPADPHHLPRHSGRKDDAPALRHERASLLIGDCSVVVGVRPRRRLEWAVRV